MKSAILRKVFSRSVRVGLTLCFGSLVLLTLALAHFVNSDFASLAISESLWFRVFLIICFIQILITAFLARPWHWQGILQDLGLLVLLAGFILNSFWGLSGYMVLQEGQESAKVQTRKLTVGYHMYEADIDSTIDLSRIGLSSLFEPMSIRKALAPYFLVKKYFPFVTHKRSFESSPDGKIAMINFSIKSPFVNLNDELDTDTKSEKKLGSVTYKLVRDDGIPTTAPTTKSGLNLFHLPRLVVKKISDDRVLTVVPIDTLRQEGLDWGPMRIELKRQFQRAKMGPVGLEEGSLDNPALEIAIKHQGQTVTELVFSKMPGFALNKNPVYGLKFEYKLGMGASSASSFGRPTGSLMEFHLSGQNPNLVRLEFFKDHKLVSQKFLNGPGIIESPWLDTQIVINSFSASNKVTSQITESNWSRGQALPPAAFLLSTVNGEEFWLAEGQTVFFETAGNTGAVYLDRKTKDLPFSLKLLKFSDEKGRLEAVVTNTNSNVSYTIAQNQPITEKGYEFRLSGAGPGLWVSYDPGCYVKWLGLFLFLIGFLPAILSRALAGR